MTIPGYFVVSGPKHLPALSLGTFLLQGLIQGGMHGILATLGFTHAIRVLGVSRAVLFATVDPVVAVLIGIPILHELPTAQQWLGVGLATAGLLATVLCQIWSVGGASGAARLAAIRRLLPRFSAGQTFRNAL